ncbi:MAG: hypothetical protein QOE70_2289 [Chthoniobacter sp.]|nr:hypothetical protein [Chthoniobacter sp.]
MRRSAESTPLTFSRGGFLEFLAVEHTDDSKLAIHDGQNLEIRLIHDPSRFGDILVFVTVNQFAVHALADQNGLRIMTVAGRGAIGVRLVHHPNQSALFGNRENFSLQSPHFVARFLHGVLRAEHSLLVGHYLFQLATGWGRSGVS